jgi:uncharacterized protein YndB with AHSA1/START domain
VRVARSVEIDAPAERVFAVLEDPERMKLWMRGLVDMRFASRPTRVGTRFTQRIREGGRVAEYAGQVTAYDPPARLGMRVGNDRFTIELDYRLHDVGGRTRLDYEARSQAATGVSRLADVVFGWLARGVARRQLRRLRHVAQASR